MLANNKELMSFGKSGWHITEIIKDPTTGGQTIYMGKCAAQGGNTSDPAWCIKKTTIEKNGDTETVTEQYADGDTLFCKKWTERSILSYKFLI